MEQGSSIYIRELTLDLSLVNKFVSTLCINYHRLCAFVYHNLVIIVYSKRAYRVHSKPLSEKTQNKLFNVGRIFSYLIIRSLSRNLVAEFFDLLINLKIIIN